MDCPYCQSTLFTQLKRSTSLGYSIFRCQQCKRDYNERTINRNTTNLERATGASRVAAARSG